AGAAGPEATEPPPAKRSREQVAAAAPLHPPLPTTPGKSKRADGVTVTARVLNADGKPLAKAAVALLGYTGDTGRGGDLEADHTRVLAQGQTDAEGRLRLAAPGASPKEVKGLYLLARAAGHAIGLERLSPDRATADVTLRLK